MHRRSQRAPSLALGLGALEKYIILTTYQAVFLDTVQLSSTEQSCEKMLAVSPFVGEAHSVSGSRKGTGTRIQALGVWLMLCLSITGLYYRQASVQRQAPDRAEKPHEPVGVESTNNPGWGPSGNFPPAPCENQATISVKDAGVARRASGKPLRLGF